MSELKTEMNKLISVLVCLWISIFLPTSVYTQSTCDFIKKVQMYQRNVKLEYQSKTYILDNISFNLGNYLGMFSKLKLDSNKVCKVYYNYIPLSGEPIIYVVPDSFNLAGYIERITEKRINEEPPTPTLKFNETICSITWYELETHHGLFQKTYEIERKSPFKVQETKMNQIFAIRLTFNY